jgi:hypothetical protein
MRLGDVVNGTEVCLWHYSSLVGLLARFNVFPLNPTSAFSVNS